MSLTNVKNNNNSRSISILKFIACLLSAFILGQLSMFLSGGFSGHDSLNISVFTPPQFVLGIIYSLVYLLMGTSLYFVIDREFFTIRSQKLKNTSIILFALQFILVLLFPFLLFSFQLYTLTFIVAALISAILTALFIINLKINAPSSLLILPCLLWFFFESYLSIIILLNNF